MLRGIGIVIALTGLFSCSPSSLEDFRYEGEARCRSLVKELQKIETREQLIRIAPVLKRHFEELVTLMIHAREFQEEHSDEEPGILASDKVASRLLEDELRRVYEIEGGREIMERAQQEALVRLDAFERVFAKKRQAIH